MGKRCGTLNGKRVGLQLYIKGMLKKRSLLVLQFLALIQKETA